MNTATRILIVEDEHVVAMDLERNLVSLGFDVIGTADRAAEAVQLAGEKNPDLVLMDIQLPGAMSGIDAAEMIRQRWRIPVVFATAFADEDTVSQATAAGPYGYITKPFRAKELNATIAVALNQHRLAREAGDSLGSRLKILTQEFEAAQCEFRELSNRLLQIHDEERRRLAHELHGSAGEIVAILNLDLAGLAQHDKQDEAGLKTKAEECRELIQQLNQKLRGASCLLHPPLLNELGLQPALTSLIHRTTEQSGLDISLNLSQPFEKLPYDMELTMFRLVQECLANVVRHSGSSTAQITITRFPASVSIEVQDQGSGISPEKLAAIETQGSGSGLGAMRDRVRQFRGKMSIASADTGTTVSVLLLIPDSVVTN
ncbi:MAG TPA: response regulator [Burkholderiales bacterium]|nr:response regulator [Burkholderiales bacterium]